MSIRPGVLKCYAEHCRASFVQFLIHLLTSIQYQELNILYCLIPVPKRHPINNMNDLDYVLSF